MALQNTQNQVNYLKNVDSAIHDYEIPYNLTSKLAALSFKNMSTPPALTPSPPLKTTSEILKTFTGGKKPNFRIEIIKPEDSERMLDFLRKNFFLDEPLNIAVNLIENEGDTCKELEEFCLDGLEDGLSIMAIGENGEIKGVNLGSAVYKNSEPSDEPSPVETCKHPRFKKIIKFLTTMEEKCDVFKFYPECNSFYDLKIVSVDSRCRGEGIAKILMKKAIELAKASNLDFVKVDCSSHISGVIVGKLGFETNFVLPYSEYTDDGEVVFKPDPPHTHFRIKSLKL